jgi:hypothetical protein
MYTHADAYVISNLCVSGFLVMSWSAFAALAVHNFVVGVPVWVQVVLYLVGCLSSFIALMVVGAFYHGHIYKLASLPVSFVSFLVFAIWPTIGHMVYGWFFDLF